MKRTAEVVVVGGGIIGASVAYHLAERGCRDVAVLERGARPGEGSTGRATGGFRCQFSTKTNVLLSLLSRSKLARFQDEHGVDPRFKQHGYLFLASSRDELEALRAANAIQRECGLTEARIVGVAEAASLNPSVSTEGVVGAAFCPTDGFIDPLEIMRGYASSAARLGVSFHHGVEVEAFEMGARGRISRVKTSEGVIAVERVVNAAGAWAAEVARLAGVELPVSPLRRQVAVAHAPEALREEMPLTIFTGDGFHLRVRDRAVLLLWPDEPRTSDPFDTSVEDGWLTTVMRKARERVPCLKDIAVDRARSWGGLYEMSPDRHALLGIAPGVGNLLLANGSSGHGVMHSPALGQLLAEMMLDGAANTLDCHALRPERFNEGDPNPACEFLC